MELISTKNIRRLFVCALMGVLFITLTPYQATAWTLNLNQIDRDKIGDLPSFSTSLFDVRVPIQISNLHPSWRSAELLVGFGAVFGPPLFVDDVKLRPAPKPNENTVTLEPPEEGQAGSGLFGACFGAVRKENILANGSYQSIVFVPSEVCGGLMSNNFVVGIMAFAKKGDTCLLLGRSCYSQGEGECDGSLRFGDIKAILATPCASVISER